MSSGQAITGDGNYQARRDININYPIPVRIPSLLAEVLPILADGTLQAEELPNAVPYQIEAKILHNALNATKRWIEDYGMYGRQVSKVYADYDAIKPQSQQRIIRKIKALYDIELARRIEESSEQELVMIVRSNADGILRSIVSEIVRDIRESAPPNLLAEDIEPCAIMVTVHAFIECNVLERPEETA